MWHNINLNCRITVNNHLRNVLRPRRETLNSNRQTLDTERTILDSERKKLSILLTGNRLFVKRISSSHGAVATTRFRGKNRTTHNNNITALQNIVKPQMTKHEENLTTLRARISTIDNLRAGMLTEINHLDLQIADLEARLNRPPLSL